MYCLSRYKCSRLVDTFPLKLCPLALRTRTCEVWRPVWWRQFNTAGWSTGPSFFLPKIERTCRLCSTNVYRCKCPLCTLIPVTFDSFHSKYLLNPETAMSFNPCIAYKVLCFRKTKQNYCFVWDNFLVESTVGLPVP